MTTKPPSKAVQPLYTLRAHTAEVQTLAFLKTHVQTPQSEPEDLNNVHDSPPTTGQTHLLFSGDVAGEVKVWNLASRRVINSDFRPHQPSGVLELQCSNTTLMTQVREGLVALWDISRGTRNPVQIACLANKCHGFCRASFVPNCSSIVETTSDSDVGETVDATPSTSRNHLILSPASDGEQVVLWDVRCNKIACSIDTSEAAPAAKRNTSSTPSSVGNPGGLCMAIAPCVHNDRPYAYVAMEAGTIALFDMLEGRRCGSMEGGLAVQENPILSLHTLPRCEAACHRNARGVDVFYTLLCVVPGVV
mgnify:CR=1 FL=1